MEIQINLSNKNRRLLVYLDMKHAILKEIPVFRKYFCILHSKILTLLFPRFYALHVLPFPYSCGRNEFQIFKEILPVVPGVIWGNGNKGNDLWGPRRSTKS